MEERKKSPEALHAWLIMLKAWQSMSHYILPTLAEEGLGESDFRVLEVLLHKGPMPVHAIGPKVYLNPGSVSVAVDRLYKKGFVSRVECSEDRRVRTVSLTEKGAANIRPSLSLAHSTHQTGLPRCLSRRAATAGKGCLRRSVNALKVLLRRKPALSLDEWIEH